MNNIHGPYRYGFENESLMKRNAKMKVIKIGLIVTATLILFGCISEQERREAQMAQTLVADIRNSIAAKDYEKAEHLCSEGKSKCPTVDYDWESVRANVSQLKLAAWQKEYEEWKRSEDFVASATMESFCTKYRIGWGVGRKRGLRKRGIKESRPRQIGSCQLIGFGRQWLRMPTTAS